MSAQVTEAHVSLVATIVERAFRFAEKNHKITPELSQLIADSEAKACDQLRAEVQRLKHGTVAQFKDAFIDELKRENTELRVSCDEHAKGYVETRKRIAALESEIDRLHAINAVRESAIARAERAEAELDGIRALADRRNKRYHVEDTTHQLVAALDQALDIAQAELATERARLDWLMEGGVCMVQHTGGFHVSRLHAPVSRAAIDAAMKEETK